MHTEIPQCKRFLCCLPLRYGLVFWGFVRLIMLLYSITTGVMSLIKMQQADIRGAAFIIQCIILPLQIIDLILVIIFIIGAFKKNVVLLKTYYFYNLYEFFLQCVLTIALGIFYAYVICLLYTIAKVGIYPSSRSWKLVMIFVTICCHLSVDGYTLILVKSEIKKLGNNCQVSFVNHTAGGEYTVNFEEVEKGEEGTVDVYRKCELNQ